MRCTRPLIGPEPSSLLMIATASLGVLRRNKSSQA
ncbi:MAG: hypothetical protein C0485_09555 [Pirellula sp.]|nr:hypothetical protein [Pirellula sp.]